MADMKVVNHRQKPNIKGKRPAILFNGPFNLIPAHEKPFSSRFSLFISFVAGPEFFKWFMSYYTFKLT